jgi:microcystin-dependent protein
MSEPFVGEIRMFGGNFAPRNWAFCDGQLLSISSNDALFSLLGTTYGGDGRTTFGLPDLRGRLPNHQGSGPGLTHRRIGQKLGVENATPTVAQLASHAHPLMGSSALASSPSPSGNVPAQSTSIDLYIDESPSTGLDPSAITSVGGGQSHANVMPFQCVSFIIALFGIYPSRS